MSLWHPVVERELVRLTRRCDLHFRRVWVAGLAGFVGLCGFGSGNLNTLHLVLFFGVLGYLVWASFTLTIGAFSEDRQNRTLELLVLSGLSVTELFLAKLGGSLALVMMYGVGLLPFLALPLVGGTVSMALIVHTVCAIGILTLWVMAVAAWASMLCRDSASAATLGILLLLAVGLGPCFFALYGGFGGAASKEWFYYWPVGMVVVVVKQSHGLGSSDFWQAAGATLGMTLGLFWMTAWVLKRICRNGDAQVGLAKTRKQVEGWFGGLRKARLRRNQLARSCPGVWLVMRDPYVSGALWILSCAMVLGGGVVLFVRGTGWLTAGVCYEMGMLSSAAMGWLYIYACGLRVGDDRRSGVLEILLTTTLSPGALMSGIREGVRRVFMPFVLAFQSVFLMGSIVLGVRDGISLWLWLTLIAAWVFLGVLWSVGLRELGYGIMWVSLNSGRPAYAVWKSLSSGAVGVALLMIVPRMIGGGVAALGQSNWATFQGNWNEVMFFCVASMGVWQARRLPEGPRSVKARLVNEFRDIAAEPLPERSDPRFKGWDGKTRLSETVARW